jgi:hypothetical protein
VDFEPQFRVFFFTAPISGKFVFNSSDNPKFKDPLIEIIFCNSSKVKCSLRFIRFITCLNRIKSAALGVNKGYLSK